MVFVGGGVFVFVLVAIVVAAAAAAAASVVVVDVDVDFDYVVLVMLDFHYLSSSLDKTALSATSSHNNIYNQIPTTLKPWQLPTSQDISPARLWLSMRVSQKETFCSFSRVVRQGDDISRSLVTCCVAVSCLAFTVQCMLLCCFLLRCHLSSVLHR